MTEHAEKRSFSFVSVVKLAIFCTATVVLLVILVLQRNEKSEVDADVQAGEARRNELSDLELKLDRREEQAKNDKGTISDILGACREASDLPDFGGPLIVVKPRGQDGALFYVPDGKHRLIVTATWKVRADVNRETIASQPSKSWEYDLLGGSGYMLQFVRDADRKHVRFELSGNHPEFSAHKTEWPFGGLLAYGYSYTGTNMFFYPNEISRFSTANQMLRRAADVRGKPLQIHEFKISGSTGQPIAGVKIVAEIVSETPVTVAAKGAALCLPNQHADLLMPYDGQGRYLLKPTVVDRTSQ